MYFNFIMLARSSAHPLLIKTQFTAHNTDMQPV